MSRFRVTVIMAGLVVAFAAMALTSNAQQPGGRAGGRGQGGPGGAAGGEAQAVLAAWRAGMWGGPGGPGGNLLMLAGNEAVQKELKLTDKQKAQVKKISEESNTSGRRLPEPPPAGRRGKNQAAQEAQAEAADGQQADPSLDARGSGAGNPLINSLNTRGYQPPIYAGQQLEDPAPPSRASKPRPGTRATMHQAQGWQMMRAAMERLQNETERELGRALDKNQVKRLKEIQLQVEGPFAVLRPEIAEKLELGEEQVARRSRRSRTRATRRRRRPGRGPRRLRRLPEVPAGQQQPAGRQAGRSQCRPPARHRTGITPAATAVVGTGAGGNGRGGNANGRGGPGGRRARRTRQLRPRSHAEIHGAAGSEVARWSR